MFLSVYILSGASGQMITQTIIIPFVANVENNPLLPLYKLRTMYIPVWYLMIFGTIGMILLVINDRSHLEYYNDTMFKVVLVGSYLWLVVGGYNFGQIGRPDLIPLVLLLSVASGVTCHHVGKYLDGFVEDDIIDTIIPVLMAGSVLYIFISFITLSYITIPGSTELAQLYLDGSVPNRCHIRWSSIEQSWVYEQNINETRRICESLF